MGAAAIGPAVSTAGGLLGAGKAGQQQQQSNASANALMNSESGLINSLGTNFTQNVLPQISQLVTQGLAGQGPLGALFGGGTTASSMLPDFQNLSTANSGLAGANSSLAGANAGLSSQVAGLSTDLTNANLFPSAGTSAMKTLLSQIGTVANPGSVISNTAEQINEQGFNQNLAAKQAGISGLSTAGGLNTSAGGLNTSAGGLNTSAGGLLSGGLGALSTGGSLTGSGLTSLEQLFGLQSPTSALQAGTGLSSQYLGQASQAGSGIGALTSGKGGGGGSAPPLYGGTAGQPASYWGAGGG
jgi:hypothetical protein